MAAKVADLLRSIVDPPLDNPPAATPGQDTHIWQITLFAGLLLLGSNGQEFGGGKSNCKNPCSDVCEC